MSKAIICTYVRVESRDRNQKEVRDKEDRPKEENSTFKLAEAPDEFAGQLKRIYGKNACRRYHGLKYKVNVGIKDTRQGQVKVIE